MNTNSWLLWVFAFMLTALSAVYQRATGPTYPVKGTVMVGGKNLTFKLPRSHGGNDDAEIRLLVPDPAVSATLEYRRHHSDDAWSQRPFAREGALIVAHIPRQPMSGQVAYRVLVKGDADGPVVLTSDPVVIRFKGAVPTLFLVAHIVIIFAGMLLSTRAGLEALRRGPQVYTLSLWAVAGLVVGGVVLGAVVQKYAFGAFWTGWPFGHDLTDNKTAAAIVFWLWALWRTRKKPTARGWVLAASLVTLAVWLIPHSVLGSELEHVDPQ